MMIQKSFATPSSSSRRRRMGSRLLQHSFAVLTTLVVVLYQCHGCHGAGLRGSSSISSSALLADTTTTTNSYELSSGLWRTSLMTGMNHPPQQPHLLLVVEDSESLSSSYDRVLVCEQDARTWDSSPYDCPANTVPICQHNVTTGDYTTRCVAVNNQTHTASIPIATGDAQQKSYCGSCKKCFDDLPELQSAVDHYVDYKTVDVALAETYGWPIGNWCVDNVTSFSHLFFQKTHFNENINDWTTRQVTDMTSTFQNAFAFNQPLDHWDTSRVTSMTRMFAMAIHFDQDLSTWDVSHVNDMGYMFLHALEFNHSLAEWQVHNAYSLNSMFFGATKFQQDLTAWEDRIHKDADTENMCQWRK